MRLNQIFLLVGWRETTLCVCTGVHHNWIGNTMHESLSKPSLPFCLETWRSFQGPAPKEDNQEVPWAPPRKEALPMVCLHLLVRLSYHPKPYFGHQLTQRILPRRHSNVMTSWNTYVRTSAHAQWPLHKLDLIAANKCNSSPRWKC